MFKNKYFLTIIVVFLLLISLPAAAETISLKEAFERGLENNLDIRQKKMN